LSSRLKAAADAVSLPCRQPQHSATADRVEEIVTTKINDLVVQLLLRNRLLFSVAQGEECCLVPPMTKRHNPDSLQYEHRIIESTFDCFAP
jgi:hypothetical protein